MHGVRNICFNDFYVNIKIYWEGLRKEIPASARVLRERDFRAKLDYIDCDGSASDNLSIRPGGGESKAYEYPLKAREKF